MVTWWESHNEVPENYMFLLWRNPGFFRVPQWITLIESLSKPRAPCITTILWIVVSEAQITVDSEYGVSTQHWLAKAWIAFPEYFLTLHLHSTFHYTRGPSPYGKSKRINHQTESSFGTHGLDRSDSNSKPSPPGKLSSSLLVSKVLWTAGGPPRVVPLHPTHSIRNSSIDSVFN